ncbi:hypothetical protein KY084_07365 [Stakelama sp. CBK3Z-3]|uniref:Inner membrane protein n=1 Tax=Stakelama flava TaxID=2860338 RepID=A0ABS6XKK6_9SPHN|nr:hypothetical protein [Stakelama flava]MBW4330696.1 hypothetical protein [Stakelama flava]
MDNGQAHDPATAPRRTSVKMLLLVGVAAFIAGLAVMAAGYVLWGDRLGLPGQSQSPAAQSPRMPVMVPNAEALGKLAARETMLDNRIGELEERLSGIDSDSRTASGFATRAEGIMVAFAARRALDRGLPLGYIEGQLSERFGTVRPRAVSVVVRAARDPVTLEDLRLSLDTLSPDLLNGGDDAGWWASTRRELSNLIVLRHDRTPSPRPSERLQRAKRMLDAGQVEGALGEVSHMPGADSAGEWMRAARNYIDARRALDLIETTALEGGGRQLAPAPVETPAPDATGDENSN